MTKSEEPEAYRLGWIPFLDCHIDLSLRPLIPRPETEYWVEGTINGAKEKHGSEPIQVLDIFAGSGCIGVAVLKDLPNAHVTFAEIEPKLIEQIKINLEKNDIGETRYTLVQSDMFEGIDKSARFDYILANPPYIADSDPEVQDSVREHEPHEALFAGPDGFKFLKPLLETGTKSLKPTGKLYAEFGSGQKGELERLYPKAEFYKDQYERWRVIGLSSTI